MSFFCLVGSTNQVKVDAAQNALKRYFSNEVEAIGYKADPGIEDWRSQHAVGQPFGVAQTAYGAINRMLGCLRQLPQSTLNNRQFSIGFENGLVPPSEVSCDSKEWLDICFVALHEVGSNFKIIRRGEFIPSSFNPGQNTDNNQFDKAVEAYETQIMPEIQKKNDLYRIWSNGKNSRQEYLERGLLTALQESEYVKQAQNVLFACIESGMAASAGPRYKCMLWTRDLAYMTPAYLEMGKSEEVLNALRAIKETQDSRHIMKDNGYETQNAFGKIPIVTIAKGRECEWIRQRLRGDFDDPFFQIQLWDFCKENPELRKEFPKPPGCKGDSIESMTLDHCNQQELVEYFHQLKNFWKNKLDQKPKGPSFALNAFIEGRLDNLTPGTRDSEIQFMRALFTLVDYLPEKKKREVLQEFGDTLGRALFYLFTTVVDPNDHLPLGADTRDNFADILYDAKLLSNGVFWYRVLGSLVRYSDDLEDTKLRQAIKDAIPEHQKLTRKANADFLMRIQDADQKLSKIFEEEKFIVEHSIVHKLLFKEGVFSPRDFVQGEHAKIDIEDLGNTKNPIPNIALVQRENPGFLSGEEVDPQSLAQAVLAGIIPAKYYDDVIECFKQADSPIGVTVFVPISAKTEAEAGVLERAKGRVVWPHIPWAIVQALLVMKESNVCLRVDPLDFAEKQRDKLMSLTHFGCGEWYAYDEGKVVLGGDPKQGWSAALMHMAMKSFYDHYNSSAKRIY